MLKAIIIDRKFSAIYDNKYYLDKDIFIYLSDLDNFIEENFELTNIKINLVIFDDNSKLINELYNKIIEKNIKISSIVYNFDYSNLEMMTYLNSKFINIENKKYFFNDFELFKIYLLEKNIFSKEILLLQYLISKYSQISLSHNINFFYEKKNNLTYEFLSKNYIYLLSVIEKIKKKKEFVILSKEEYQKNEWRKFFNFIESSNRLINFKFI